MLPYGRVVVFFDAADEAGALTLVARVRDSSGHWGPRLTISSEASYPRFAVRAEQAVVAFTSRSSGASRVVVTDWATAERTARPERQD